jgi:hypothetical protein
VLRETEKSTHVLILLFMMTFLLLIRTNIKAEGQGWFSNSLNLTVNSKFSLTLKSQIRSHNITFQDPFVYFLESGADYKLPKDFRIGAFYRRQTSGPSNLLVHENRYILVVGWRKTLNQNLSFEGRFRTERRSFEQNTDVNHFRFRLYIRFTMNVKLGELKLKPFVAEEPFWDTKVDAFSQNRFYLGTVIPLSEKVEFVLSYLKQDLKNKESNHVLYTGFNLRF